jgi:hypothetical protein
MECMWPLLGFVVLLLLTSPAHGDGPPQRDQPHPPSIHARQLQYWNQQPTRDWKRIGPQAPKTWPRHERAMTQTHHVLGFHPYWMGTNYLAYDWSTLHTVVFFGLELDAAGGISNAHGWPWTQLVQHAHDHGARVLVAATQFSSTDLATLLGSATYRSTAVANLVNAMLQGKADGLCLDFEAIPGTRKQQYVDFADELRDAMDISLPQSVLIITTPAVDWNNAYDYDELAARSDYLMLMAYDYHWSGSTTSGPVAPLSGWGTYNVSWSIQDHLVWGAPPRKLLLGVPYYGYRWGTTSADAGASTATTGTALTYGNVQPLLPQQEELWDASSQTPWLRVQDPDWQQTWFDDASSLGAKYTTVLNEDLAGVGIWALGYDDPYTALWNALHDAFDQVTSDRSDAFAPNASPLRVLSRNPFSTEVTLRLVLLPQTEVRQDPERTSHLVRIFDSRGRLVQTLRPLVVWSTSAQFIWDGRSRHGTMTVPGIYFARADTSVRTVRLIKLR